MGKLIYEDLTYKLNGICFKVHGKLGRFCREKQYADALEALLQTQSIAYQREHEVPFKVDGKSVKGNRADFVIEDKLILELKAKPIITKDDYYQMQRYLSATGYKLGLIVNFRHLYLKSQRVINSSVDPHG